jgi:spore maturation protein CgeB
MAKFKFSTETLAKNIQVLSKTNPTAANWLADSWPGAGLELVEAEDGSPILVVDGLSQDSRVKPRDAAHKLLANALGPDSTQGGVWLFGLGSPPTLMEAIGRLPTLTVYEPDPKVVVAVLSLFDLDRQLASGQLRLYCPWNKADDKTAPAPSVIITHQPSKRRHPSAWAGLAGHLKQGAEVDQPTKARQCGLKNLRLLIIPPYSGGSEPLGGFLFRAAGILGLKTKLLDWPQDLRRRAEILKTDPQAAAGDLLTASAREAAKQAREYEPTLILNLAQAPLDAQGLAQLRQEARGALLAFWFVEDFKRFKYVAGIAPAYDLFFHIQGRLLDKELRDWGLGRAWYLPLAADDSVFMHREVPAHFRAELSVAGAGYPNRRAILADLAENYWAKSGRAASGFKIFGSDWDGSPPILAKHLFENGRRLSTMECALAYAGGQVNLNLHSGDGAGFDPLSAFVNPRTFELASCGSLQVVDNRDLMTGLFDPDELVLVGDPTELPSVIEKHLKNPGPGKLMAQKARKRVLKEHLYVHRLRFILECSGLWPPDTGH